MRFDSLPALLSSWITRLELGLRPEDACVPKTRACAASCSQLWQVGVARAQRMVSAGEAALGTHELRECARGSPNFHAAAAAQEAAGTVYLLTYLLTFDQLSDPTIAFTEL